MNRSFFRPRRIVYYFCAGLLIIFIMWAWGYYSLLKRGGYDYGVAFLKVNPTIKTKLGEITVSRLGYVNFKESYSGGRWTARFYVVLKGQINSGVAFIELESFKDTWEIKKCDLETNEGILNIVPPVN